MMSATMGCAHPASCSDGPQDTAASSPGSASAVGDSLVRNKLALTGQSLPTSVVGSRKKQRRTDSPFTHAHKWGRYPYVYNCDNPSFLYPLQRGLVEALSEIRSSIRQPAALCNGQRHM